MGPDTDPSVDETGPGDGPVHVDQTVAEILAHVETIRTDLDQVLAAGTNQAFAMTMLMERAEPIADLARRLDDLDVTATMRKVLVFVVFGLATAHVARRFAGE